MRRFFRKKLPAALLALAMLATLVPTAAAATADISYEVEVGEEIVLSRTEFRDFFEENYEDFSYMTFTEYDDLDTYGYLQAMDQNGDWKDLDEDDLDDNVWFYYSSSDVDNSIDCCLKDLTFVADEYEEGTLVLEFTLYGDDDDDYVDGILEIEIYDEDSQSSSDIEITYKVDPDDEVMFDEDDFENLFEDEITNEDFRRMKFTSANDMDDYGRLYTYDYLEDDYVRVKESEVSNSWFYLASEADDDDYLIDDLYFAAFEDTDGEVIKLEFSLRGEDGTDLDGVLYIEIGDVDDSYKDDADITYTVDPDDDVAFDEDDFQDFFESEESSEDLYCMEITSAKDMDDYGRLYAYDYAEDDYVRIKESYVNDYYFYWDSDDDDDYLIDDLLFEASEDAGGHVVELKFILYGDGNAEIEGVLRIEIGSVETSQSGDTSGDILYVTTYNTNVQLKSSDFDRYLKKSFPSSSLQYVKLAGVPAAGGLYYNYYGASAYGTSARTKLTSSNCDDQYFYFSPSDTAQYALSELTYVPSNTNYCAEIPFTAYGSGNHSVTGSVLISVSLKAVSEVYGVVPTNTAVNFPAPSIVAAVVAGTSSNLYSIQLLELPSSKQGTIYVGTGTSRKADTQTLYTYSGSNSWQISQLRFVPASGYTGSVEVPYAACDSKGTPIAIGKFCLGFVPSVKKFSDVTSSAWCYKYITELASAGVIDGYADGTYKFNNTVTYGAALKLVMLAAGYPEQAPTVKGSTFSGYLDKARAEGIITRSNVDLSKPITRLQVAQLAAGALDLDISNLSSIKPFTDTSDLHVQALNAAGIVEGYFANGTSTYKPGNTLTRGQLSAIVWRMQNYVK